MTGIKNMNTKRIVPLLFLVMGAVFAILGFTKLGFWNSVDGPMPGFFPSIMAIVMVLTSFVAFIQSFKETGEADYNINEFMVIAGGIGIFVATFIIGLVPSLLLYIIIWVKLIEKSSWKATIILLAVASFISIVVFGLWLGVQFPMGIFENI